MSEKQLLQKAAAGDKGAMEELLIAYMGMVKALARRYYIVGAASEDAWQEGMIGLYKAICTYKEEKGKFSAYAYACIKANILDAVKAASREKNRPLNNYVPLEKTELVSSDDLTDDIGDRQLMERIRAGLNGEEEKIFELWAEGCSYAEIAEEIKKSVKYVDNALQRIRRKAKKILSGREDI